MSTRTLTLTNTLHNVDNSAAVGVAVGVYLLVPAGVPAVNLESDVLFSGSQFGESTTTNASGVWSATVVYPGDLVPTGCQLVVVEGTNITVSPIGFSYASSITVSSWYPSGSTTGTLPMLLDVHTVANAADQGIVIRFGITATAVDPNSNAINAGATVPITTDSTGKVTLNLFPSSQLNPANTAYFVAFPDGSIWYFTCPVHPTGYQGAYNGGTAYHVNAGTLASPSDVVSSGGVYYQAIADTTGHAPPNATYWQVWPGEPIPWDLTTVSVPGAVAITAAGVSHSSDVPVAAGDPEQTPLTLSDDLENLVYRDTQRLRWLGVYNNAVAYVPNDVISSGGVAYICIATTTGHAPPNVTYWVAIGAAGGAGSATFTWVAKTADYTVAATDSGIAVDASSGNVTITLLTAVGTSSQFAFKRLDASTHTVTIATTGGQTIDGSATYTLPVSDQVVIVGSTNTGWLIAGGFYPSPLTSEGDIPYLHNGVVARLVLGAGLAISGGVLNTAVAGSQAPATVYAGPTTGAPATPAFRTLVPTDLPIASASQRGAARADGTTITAAADGTFSAVSSGSTLASLGDAAISGPHDGDLLVYRTSDSKWHNVDPTAPGGGAVYWAPLTDSAGNLIVDANGSCLMMPAAV
jgi:hypothetical protein